MRNKQIKMMPKILLFLLLISAFCSPAMAQRKKKVNTAGQGTFFMYFGYNRSAYTPTTIDFVSPNYNFSMENVAGTDNTNDGSIANYLSADGFETFQFNVHMGYYIKPKWALTFGIDRLNYFMANNQTASLSGAFSPGNHAEWNGVYDNEEVQINRSNIFYRQEAGMNYLRVGILHTQELFQSKKGEVVLSLNTGIGTGLLLSNSVFTYDGLTNTPTSGTSGFGLSGHVGLRADFFQRLFLQTTFSGGMLKQGNIQLDQAGNANASHTMGYFSPEIALGFLVYVRPTNNCGTCPQW
jgi:hypothetical protein